VSGTGTFFQRLCIETDARGPRVTEAWFAALAIEWGCEWITGSRLRAVSRPEMAGAEAAGLTLPPLRPHR
jgi:hypothetical protein